MTRSVQFHTPCAPLWQALLVLMGMVSTAFGADRPPNVVFILADDLGYHELGSFGQEKIRTPHLDRLAREGLRLTQHYSGNAVCAPSRCVLMTGLHPGHAYIRANKEIQPEGQHPIPDAAVTLAELLHNQGYATGAFGKWDWADRIRPENRCARGSIGSSGTTANGTRTATIPVISGATAFASR